ncbi:hypothetical protein M5K25_015020 [Dendrobium thyrsiflorum]|uniref:Uncharacterized protein n=1 Tax=Dendrobium thyrsiflorum TaxID=117978 RepID=A0ABD0UPU1_DENTH
MAVTWLAILNVSFNTPFGWLDKEQQISYARRSFRRRHSRVSYSKFRLSAGSIVLAKEFRYNLFMQGESFGVTYSRRRVRSRELEEATRQEGKGKEKVVAD